MICARPGAKSTENASHVTMAMETHKRMEKPLMVHVLSGMVDQFHFNMIQTANATQKISYVLNVTKNTTLMKLVDVSSYLKIVDGLRMIHVSNV